MHRTRSTAWTASRTTTRPMSIAVVAAMIVARTVAVPFMVTVRVSSAPMADALQQSRAQLLAPLEMALTVAMMHLQVARALLQAALTAVTAMANRAAVARMEQRQWVPPASRAMNVPVGRAPKVPVPRVRQINQQAHTAAVAAAVLIPREGACCLQLVLMAS